MAEFVEHGAGLFGGRVAGDERDFVGVAFVPAARLVCCVFDGVDGDAGGSCGGDEPLEQRIVVDRHRWHGRVGEVVAVGLGDVEDRHDLEAGDDRVALAVVESSVNVTVPVGMPAPGATALTVAVKATVWPKTDGFTEAVIADVVVLALFTVTDMDVLLAVKLLLPR